MKKLLFLASLSSLLFADKLYELNVPSMGCGGCASRIKKVAENIKSFKSMTYDTKTKDVNITLSDDGDIQEIIKAVRDIKPDATLK